MVDDHDDDDDDDDDGGGGELGSHVCLSFGGKWPPMKGGWWLWIPIGLYMRLVLKYRYVRRFIW